MDDYIRECYIKAGKVLAKARDCSAEIVKDGAWYLDVIRKLEKKVPALGGSLACPVTISINEMGAHDTAMHDDTRVFKKGDIVKVDFGVHVDGYIADAGHTLEVGVKENQNLIKASEEALNEAIKLVKPGVELWRIGEKIEKVISAYGLNPITNLSGHSIERYDLHAGITIPNYNNGSKFKLKKDMTITIEPFATFGDGQVNNYNGNKIYSLIEKKPVRIAFVKDVMDFIEKNYKTLPFAVRWLHEAELKNYQYALQILEKQGVVHGYKPLIDSVNGLVSYKEHTMIVDDEVIITTI